MRATAAGVMAGPHLVLPLLQISEQGYFEVPGREDDVCCRQRHVVRQPRGVVMDTTLFVKDTIITKDTTPNVTSSICHAMYLDKYLAIQLGWCPQ